MARRTTGTVLVKLGLPKGSLQESTLELFRRAGFKIVVDDRGYFPSVDDEEIEAILLRAQEISRYVEDGVLDAGLTGHDWIVENDSQVVEVCELFFSKASDRPVRWVVAVPVESPVRSVRDLQGKLVATDYQALPGRAWCRGQGGVFLGGYRGQGRLGGRHRRGD